MARPTKNSDDARQALIDAARQKFVSKPYDKVSIRELSTLAGVNSAMIKYYFGSKEGLYKAMILEVTGQVITNIKRHLLSGPVDSMEQFFRSFVEVIKQSPEFPLLMLKELILNQGVDRQYFVEQVGQVHLKVFDQIFSSLKSQGKLKDEVDPSLFRLSLMSLTLHPWYMRDLIYRIEGTEFDDEFLEKMIAHNSQLMSHGLFNPSEGATHVN